MTIVSDDPSLWPLINSYRFTSYFIVAAAVIVAYDWALTFGQEVELIWRQRWSLMTVLYLSVRYLGMLYNISNILGSVPTILLTDARCEFVWSVLPGAYHWLDSSGWTMYIIWDLTTVVVTLMLWVIMIARLHAMYQRSRKILIFLVITFLADGILSGVAMVMTVVQTSGEELVFSGTYQCSIAYAGDTLLLNSVTWILGTVWEVFALCLAVWVAVKHFSELRQHSAGGIIGDCFTVLMKTHMFYFASFFIVSCCHFIELLSPTNLADQSALVWFLQIFPVVQMFVLGPRLILGVREYNAKLVADSGAATSMTSIAFQERVHISTGNSV